MTLALGTSHETIRFRPLSATEAVYVRANTQVVSHSAASGEITPRQFQTALAALEAHYPILRAAIRDEHFVERAPAITAPCSWLDRETHNLATLYEEALTRPIDFGHSIYAIQLLADARGFDILMVSSHAVADATSLVAIHSSLIHFCDCAVRGIVPPAEPQKFPDSIDPMIKDCHAALAIPVRPAAAPSYSAADCIRLPLQAAASASPPHYQMEQLIIEPGSVAAIIAAGHSHDVSLHSLLAAAFVLAIRKLNGGGPGEILLRHTVDMRRRLQPHISIDLVFTAVTAHVTHLENIERPIFEIARSVQTDIRGATADGRILQDYLNYPQSFGTPQTAPIAFSISDMGVVAFHDEIAVLTPVGFDYATAIPQPFPHCSITIYGNRFVANTVYRQDMIAPAVMQALSKEVIEILRQSAGPDSTSVAHLSDQMMA